MDKSFLKNIAKGIFWRVYGGTVRNPPLPSKIKSVLFICLGNICRSPFAERIAAKYSNASNDIAFSSAGIRVDAPKSPPIEAIDSAKDFGVELRDHASRQLQYGLMESHDIIITVEIWQYKYLKKMFMEFQDKIFLLPLFCINNNISQNIYDKYNIRDPYGRNYAAYDECFEKIKKCINGLFHSINVSKKNK